MLSDPRTICDFTTSDDGKRPIELAKERVRINKARNIIDNDSKGVSFKKCFELLEDWKIFRNKPKVPKIQETAKKLPRHHSRNNVLDFKTPTKVNSVHKKVLKIDLAKQKTEERKTDFFSNEGSVERYDADDIKNVITKILAPYKISDFPSEFLSTDWTYYTFHGIIGKQSKVMKRIMERKIRVDIIDGTL